MSKSTALFGQCVLALLSGLLFGCGSSSNPSFQLTVQNTAAAGAGGTITSSPSGINCGSTCSTMFNKGTTVTLTAAANSGSTFSGWSGGGCSGTGTCAVTLTAATTVMANFTVAPTTTFPLTVQNSAATGAGGTVTSSPSGINCGTVCTATFNGGTAVTLTATPNTGSTFTGWSGGGCSGTSTCTVTLTAATTVTASFATTTPASFLLTVALAGAGTGTVTSNPAGITCGSTCSASFAGATSITLTAAASTGSAFAGWSGGGCSGTSPCTLTLNAPTTVTATFNPGSLATSINHIIFLAQENRSFDNYFGALRGWWATNGFPDQSFDGLPQFNPTTGAAPLNGPAPSNPGCDPTKPPPSDCIFDTNNPVSSYHLQTVCTENTSPSWNEAHVDWNYNDQVGLYPPAALNGFVFAAGHDARTNPGGAFMDVNGIRAMGYYDGTDLNYYYFMASNFATSDRWFHPAMARTQPNREYLIAGTSQGHAYPLASNAPVLTATTIFEELQNAGITWKIYVDPTNTGCAGPPYQASCLVSKSYVSNFAFAQTIINQYPNNIAPISQYFTDLQNGTLPQVAQIEPASDAGFDEHGSNSDAIPTNIQSGANYVESLINGLMQSSSWNDSAFILTYDEYGGLYDHVAPQPTVSPDGIKPMDLMSGDVCTTVTGPTCDFTYTGYRVPLVVVSPFAKKNYVSHTVTDYTAILKLIETRFGVPALTKRDAAQMDMTEFFNFTNPPWLTPPSNIPTQNTSGACNISIQDNQ